MPRPSLDEIYAAYAAQKDPMWIDPATEEFWRSRIDSGMPARSYGDASEPLGLTGPPLPCYTRAYGYRKPSP